MTVHVLGSLNMDLVVTLDRMPLPGETVFGHTFTHIPGGKGLNQAIAAARAGASVSLTGAVGNDAYGRDLLNLSKLEGIDISSVDSVENISTGTAHIEVESSGENRIVVVSGANQQCPELNVDNLSKGDVLLTQFEVPMSRIIHAFEAARERDVITVLNPAPVMQIDTKIIALTTYLIPNEHEAAMLTGSDTSSIGGIEIAAKKLIEMGARNVIITRGAAGIYWANELIGKEIPAYKIQPLDTTAAGDAFCGVFATALSEGVEEETSLRIAMAAGALTATKTGATTSLPLRNEITSLMERNP